MNYTIIFSQEKMYLLLNYKRILSATVCSLWFICAVAQGFNREAVKKIDSILALPAEDTVKIDLLQDASQEIILADSAKSLQYAEKALELALKTKSTKWTAFAYYQLGSIYFIYDQFSKGSEFYDKAISVIKDTDPVVLIKLYTGYAWAYDKEGLFTQSVENYQKALNVSQKFNLKRKEAGILSAMGRLFFYNKQYRDGIRYHLQSLEVAENIKDSLSELAALESLVSGYVTLYKKKSKDSKILDSSIFYLNRAYVLLGSKFKLSGNRHIEPALHLGEGEVYFLKEDYKKAADKLDLAVKEARNLKDDALATKSYLMLSKVYFKQGKNNEARQIADTALRIAETAGDPILLNESYEEMINVLTEQTDTTGAFRLQAKLLGLKDTLFTTEKMKSINTLQIQYETAKKEFKIKDLKRKNFFILFSLVTGFIVALLFFRSYRLRKKLLLHKQQLLQEENRKIILEKQLEKEETLRKQQEYENTLQLNKLEQEQLQQQVDFKYRELTAQMVQLEKKNDILLQIKTDLQKITEKKEEERPGLVKTTIKVIDQNLSQDDDFDNFRLHFENIHPDFFTKLIEKSNHQLSQLDLKHCAYIKMNFDTRAIANLLNVEPKSIRMARYRLKQKLNLDREMDLVDFINII